MHRRRQDLLRGERGARRLVGGDLRVAAVAGIVVDQFRVVGDRVDARGVQALGELIAVHPGLVSYLDSVLMPGMHPVSGRGGEDQAAQPGQAGGQQRGVAAAVGLDGGQPVQLHAAIAACRSVSRKLLPGIA